LGGKREIFELMTKRKVIGNLSLENPKFFLNIGSTITRLRTRLTPWVVVKDPARSIHWKMNGVEAILSDRYRKRQHLGYINAYLTAVPYGLVDFELPARVRYICTTCVKWSKRQSHWPVYLSTTNLI